MKPEKIDAIGEGYLIPTPKPNKTAEIKNLRPIILLNAVRKILSMITVRRIEQRIDEYTGPWQQAYKTGEGCQDVVWCQSILTSVVQRKKWSYRRMGIDMSRAFDNIKRSVILNLPKDAGCPRDDLRLVQALITDTKLSIKVENKYLDNSKLP